MTAPVTSQIDDVFVDCTLSVDHKYENDVTAHPAETGSDYTDNSINKPLVISLDCVISATPIGVNPNASFGPNIVDNIQGRLVEINFTREPITIIDVYGRFDNMMIESLTFSKTIKTGEALAFKISLKQLKIVTNNLTVVQVAVPRAQAANKKGVKDSKQPPDPPVNAVTEDKRSRLRRVANYIAPGFISNKPNPGGGL